MLIGLSAGQHHRAERVPLARPVDRRGLAQRRVDALQPRQVEDHDVARVPPRGGHEHRPQVDVGVAEPVDQVALLGGPEDVVEQALLRRVDELPDEADDGQREHDGQEEDALVDARATDLLVEQVGEQQPEHRRHEREEDQPDDVVAEGRPERRVDLEDLLVVAGADPLDRRDPADAVPAREREERGEERRDPHQSDDDEAAARRPSARPRPCRRRSVERHGGGDGRNGVAAIRRRWSSSVARCSR